MAEPLIRESILEMPTGAEPSQVLKRLRSSLPEAFRSRLRSARELERENRDAAGEGAFATAVPALDRLLDGGLPRGQLVELVGGRTSGRFSTLLAVLAAATSIGEAAALVDLGDGLDPVAALALGADLERLLWLRPTNLKDALAAAEMLLASGFPLVVLDLGQPPVRGGRGVEAGWLRLARAARAHDSALLVSAPYRVSGTAAGVVLKAERARAAWQGQGAAPRLLAGLAASLVLEKRRGQLPGRTEGLTLSAPGVPRPSAPLPEVRPRKREEEKPAAAPALTLVRRAS
jgi:recA bacterial DNA recombination protein